MCLSLKCFAACVLSFALANSAVASPICNPFRSPPQEPQLSNCERVVQSKDAPSLDALTYSLKYMMDNQGTLQDSSCAATPRSHSPQCAWKHGDTNVSCPNLIDPEWTKKGFTNHCSFVVNDVRTQWTKKGERAPGRTKGYFIDLCAKKSKQLITQFYINGSKGKLCSDTPLASQGGSNNSTLCGAFKLDNQFSEFYVEADNKRGQKAYSAIRARHSGDEYPGGVPALHMAGLNSSNNQTDFDKPFHASAFGRGLGCVGVADSTTAVMKKLAAEGISLYMAYAGKDFEQHGNSCQVEGLGPGETVGPRTERSSKRAGRGNRVK